MKITVIGSHLCPDTIYAICKLTEKKIDFDFKDISSSFPALKEYLSLRENNSIYEEVKSNGGLGIPRFLTGEKVTLDINDVL
jgi:glutaredoxin-related protein